MPNPCNAIVNGVIQILYLECIFGRFVDAIWGFGGITLFVLLIIGGYKYISSGGDPKALEEAKKTLTYAICGTVLLSCAFLILKFIQVFTGVDVTRFKVTQP